MIDGKQNPKEKSMIRDNRKKIDLREIKIIPNYIKNVPGSALIEQGNTRIICTATYFNKVPQFLKDSKKGWIIAEYSMLPGSTGNERIMRERQKVNSRNIEIQRFIGRALRSTFDLRAIDGKTIFIDADVIQADGSTRCASINCGMIALVKSLKHLVFEHKIPELPKIEFISAVSIGVKKKEIYVDLTYKEDSNIDADISIVSSETQKIIEVQAMGEESSIPKEIFKQVIDIGIKKNLEIIKILKRSLE